MSRPAHQACNESQALHGQPPDLWLAALQQGLEWLHAVQAPELAEGWQVLQCAQQGPRRVHLQPQLGSVLA